MMRSAAALLMLLPISATAASYWTYPNAAPLTGTEIVGPIRQNGQDVVTTLNAIAGIPGLFAYPAAGALDGTELINAYQRAAAVEITIAQMQAYAQQVAAAGITDSNATGCSYTITHSTAANLVYCVDRSSGLVQQGSSTNHYVYHVPLRVFTTGPGPFYFLNQDLMTGLPAMVGPAIATAEGIMNCTDAMGDAASWRISGTWAAPLATSTSLTSPPAVVTQLFASGTTTGWGPLALSIGLYPSFAIGGVGPGVSCTAEVNYIKTGYGQ